MLHALGYITLSFGVVGGVGALLGLVTYLDFWGGDTCSNGKSCKILCFPNSLCLRCDELGKATEINLSY